ncbi:MarR family transcriptional regulator [soil metagenome]
MSDPAWLDADEQQAWRGLIAVAMLLPGAIDGHLKPLADLTNFDYFILAVVSEAPDRAVRLRDLAAQSNSSLSRLSHAVSRLERRGLLRRRPDPADARTTDAVLTDAGWDLVTAVAPQHVAHVRDLVFDHLDAEQVRQLRDIAEVVCRRLVV